MDKFDKKIALFGALAGLTYAVGGVAIINCNEKKTIKMMDAFHDKCKIMCWLIDERFEKHEITEDKWIELNDEVIRIRWDYTKEMNKILDDDRHKYGIVNSVKTTKHYTRITKEYTKKIDRVGMKLNCIDIIEPDRIIID